MRLRKQVAEAVSTNPAMRRQAPARALAVEPDVQVLWLRALITGGLVGLFALLLIFWPITVPEFLGGGFLPALLILKWVLCGVVLLVLAVWVWLVIDTRNHLWAIEETLQRDLDGDGVAGPPPAPLASFEVHLHGPLSNQHKVVWMDVPIPLPAFDTFVTAALNGRALTESDWAGGGNPFNLAQFKRLRAWMLQHGFGQWRNAQAHDRGWELNLAGRDMLRHFQQWYAAHRDEFEHTRTHAHTSSALDFAQGRPEQE
jgi:hypothetical protein